MLAGASVSSVSRYSRLETTEQNPTPLSFMTRLRRGILPPYTQARRDGSHASLSGDNRANLYESPLFDNNQYYVTGMGQMILPGAEGEDRRGSTQFKLYHTSSTAFAVRFAYQMMPARLIDGSRAKTAYNMLQDTSTMHEIDSFSLLPRTCADDLVERFSEKFFILNSFLSPSSLRSDLS